LSVSTKGCSIAKTAFDEAVTELDSLDEESYKETASFRREHGN